MGDPEVTKLPPTPGGEGYESPPDKAMEQWHTDPAGGYTDPSVEGVEALAKKQGAAQEGTQSDPRADLEAKTNAELQTMLEEKGQPTSGNKAELIDRLLEG